MALRVWLPLNGTLENKGISDVTVTNNGATVDNNGKIGKCYSFNGTNAWIKVSMPSAIKDLKNTSIAFWAMGNRSFGGISHDGGATLATCTFYTSWQFANGSWVYFSGGAVSSSVWHHYAITVSDSTITTYCDGAQVTSSALASNIVTAITSSNFIELGCDHPGGDEYGTDKMNDFRIYDHVLSPKEVKEISQGLILHYKLDGWNGGAGENILPCGGLYTKENPWSTTLSRTDGYAWVTGSAFEAKPSTTYTISVECDGTLSSGHSSGGLTPADKPWTFWLYICNSNTTKSWSSGSYDTPVNLNSTNNNFRKIGNTYVWTYTLSSNQKYISLRTNSYSDGSTNVTIKWWNMKIEEGDTFTSYSLPLNDLNIDTTKITDSSGYENDGTVIGNLQTINENMGRYNSHTYFTDYTCGISSNLGGFIPTAITMSCWVKSSNKSPRGSHHLPLNISSTNFEISVASSGQARMGYVVNGTRYVSNIGPDILDGQWHMITSTFDGATICRYVDGTLINSEARAGTLTAANTVGVGVFPGGTTYGNTEMLESDVRIYATALSVEDIAELYHTPASIDNLGNAHTFEFIEDNNNRINKNGSIKNKLYSELIQLEDGSLWVPICVHNIDGGNNMFATTDDFSVPVYHSHDLWANFPNIESIDRPENGYYEFLVKQQNNINGDWSTYRFKQTVNPLTATWATAGPSSGNVTWISGYSGTGYGGMYKLSSPTATSSNYMCFSNGSNGNWFGCGCKQYYQGGIPSICNTVPKGWQLVYMRASKYLYKNYKLGITEATSFIEK